MKVALVGPELEENLALRYLHSALCKAGHECRIFDFNARQQIGEIAGEISAFAPDLVGLSMVFTARSREFIELAATLRQKHGYKGHITAGGHFASFHAELLLGSFASITTIIHGEGELPLVGLADNLRTLQKVNNLSYRDDSGAILRTARQPNVPDLDVLSWPTRTLPMHSYLGFPIANILGSRGCFGSCSFCSISAWHRENGGARVRFRTPADVAREMAYLYHECGVRIFNFHDDNFFYPRESDNVRRFRELKHHLKKEHVAAIALQIKSRPDTISQPVVTALKELGLFRVFLGIENNAVAGLKALGRGITRACNHRALHILKSNGIHTTFNLLMFEPEMTPGDLLDNIAIINQHPSFPLNFGRVEVYGGTPLETRLSGEHRLVGNYFGYSYVIKDPSMQNAFELFRRVFYGRNFEADGLNHLCMRVDYHYHLLRHFYPRLVTGTLGRETKDAIARLNRNSALLLGSIHDFVTKNPRAPKEVVEQFGADLLVWRQGYDTQAREEIMATIRSIERCAADSSGATTSPMRGLTTAAAAAAILVVASVACDSLQGRYWHVSEMIAMPLDSADWDAAAMVPQYEADNISSRIYVSYGDTVRAIVDKYGFTGKPICIDLMMAYGGSVSESRVSVTDTTGADAFCNELMSTIAGWVFAGVKQQGRCTINLTVMQIPYPPDYIRQDTIDYHMSEMFPAPADSSPAEPVDISLTEIIWNDSLWNAYQPFDALTEATIGRMIDSMYYGQLTAAISRYPLFSGALTVDMILDAFGDVRMFRLRWSTVAPDAAMTRQLSDLVGQWTFPIVKTQAARPGKFSVSFTFTGKETHYSEMMPIPVNAPSATK